MRYDVTTMRWSQQARRKLSIYDDPLVSADSRRKGCTHGCRSLRVWADLCLSTPIRLEVCNERQSKRKERGRWGWKRVDSIDYRLEPEKEHSLMDSNTAYHFSRLLQPHPTTVTAGESLKWNAIECVRENVQRKKQRKISALPETEIVTRHRIPVFIAFHESRILLFPCRCCCLFCYLIALCFDQQLVQIIGCTINIVRPLSR